MRLVEDYCWRQFEGWVLVVNGTDVGVWCCSDDNCWCKRVFFDVRDDKIDFVEALLVGIKGGTLDWGES